MAEASLDIVVRDLGGSDQDRDGNVDAVEIVGDWDPLSVDVDEDGTVDWVQSPATVSPVAQGYRNWILGVATRDGIDNDEDGQIASQNQSSPHI